MKPSGNALILVAVIAVIATIIIVMQTDKPNKATPPAELTAPAKQAKPVQKKVAKKSPTEIKSSATQPPAQEAPRIIVNAEAIESMRHARIHGEPRTPPIIRSKPRVLPTAAELADEDLYLQYEQKERNQILSMYHRASIERIAKLEAHLELAKDEGFSQEALDTAAEKIKSLQQLQQMLENELPELIEADSEDSDSEQFDFNLP